MAAMAAATHILRSFAPCPIHHPFPSDLPTSYFLLPTSYFLLPTSYPALPPSSPPTPPPYRHASSLRRWTRASSSRRTSRSVYRVEGGLEVHMWSRAHVTHVICMWSLNRRACVLITSPHLTTYPLLQRSPSTLPSNAPPQPPHPPRSISPVHTPHPSTRPPVNPPPRPGLVHRRRLRGSLQGGHRRDAQGV